MATFVVLQIVSVKASINMTLFFRYSDQWQIDFPNKDIIQIVAVIVNDSFYSLHADATPFLRARGGEVILAARTHPCNIFLTDLFFASISAFFLPFKPPLSQ